MKEGEQGRGRGRRREGKEGKRRGGERDIPVLLFPHFKP